jgi:hypothetical protein
MIKEFYRDKRKGVYLTLTLEQSNGLINVDWCGFLSLAEIMNGSEETLLLIQEFKCTKLLVDNRKVSGPWQHANRWYEEDWNPRAAQAGLSALAFIMPSDLFTQLSLEGYVKVVNGLFATAIFRTEEDARKWLSEQTPA